MSQPSLIPREATVTFSNGYILAGLPALFVVLQRFKLHEMLMNAARSVTGQGQKGEKWSYIDYGTMVGYGVLLSATVVYIFPMLWNNIVSKLLLFYAN
jgi:hypothetical protein